MDIKPKERLIREILGIKKQYEIPRFQRDYSWDKRNYREFIYDIVGNLVISGDKVMTSPYFMGTMLFVGDSEDENQKSVQVVDGQQRLTTITILFSVLAHIFKGLKEEKLSEKVFSYVMAEDDNGDMVRIIKTTSSYPYFSYFIQSLNQEHANSSKTEEERSIEQTYNYYKEQLTEDKLRHIFKKLKIDSSGVNYIDLLKAIRDQVLSSTIVEIYTKDNSLANKLFEILNAKGKQLAHIDLIKNKIFEKLGTEPADYAQESWKEIITMLNDGKERTGFVTFYRHFWASYYGRATASALYEKFIRNIKPENYESFLALMVSEAKVYKRITNPSRDDYENRKEYYWLVNSLKSFNDVFNVIQSRVPLLALFSAKEKGYIKGKKIKEVITYLENFHFAYNAILALKPNKIDPIYTKFAVSLRKCTSALEATNVIQTQLFDKLDPLFPAYPDFEKKFIELSYSNKVDLPSNVKAKYVVNKLYCYYDGRDVHDDAGTIEHIIPDSSKESHNIGNLILLEQALNNDAGDKQYLEKKVQYSQSSYKWVSDFISQHPTWEINDIQARSKALAKVYYTGVMERIVQ